MTKFPRKVKINSAVLVQARKRGGFKVLEQQEISPLVDAYNLFPTACQYYIKKKPKPLRGNLVGGIQLDSILPSTSKNSEKPCHTKKCGNIYPIQEEPWKCSSQT